MQTYPECFECIIRQALIAAQLAGADESQQFEVLNHTLDILRGVDLSVSPSEISLHTNKAMREITGCDDSYWQSKEASTQQALKIYPQLKTTVDAADDPRDTALRLSIAGNVIDMVMGETYDLPAAIDRALSHPFAIDHRAELWAAIDRAEQVLYLADNAGETVFDRLLIEQIDIPVIYAVKGGAILNDATREDAFTADVNTVARIIETGTRSPGTLLHFSSRAFRSLFNEVEVIIAKGQANYETLSNGDERVFHLLQVKCPIIGRDIGSPVGSMIAAQDAAIQRSDAAALEPAIT